jgi:hypothetical protein
MAEGRDMKIERVHKIIALALTVGGMAWWWFGHISEAQTDHEEQITMEQAVEKLVAIHIRQDTIEEAEEALLKQLCDEGKLVECAVVTTEDVDITDDVNTVEDVD